MKGQISTWEIVISITMLVITAAFVTMQANAGSPYAMQNLKLSKNLYDAVNVVVNDGEMREAIIAYLQGGKPEKIVQRVGWISDEFGINMEVNARGTGFYGKAPAGDSLAFQVILPIYNNTKYEKVEVRVYG